MFVICTLLLSPVILDRGDIGELTYFRWKCLGTQMIIHGASVRRPVVLGRWCIELKLNQESRRQKLLAPNHRLLSLLNSGTACSQVIEERAVPRRLKPFNGSEDYALCVMASYVPDVELLSCGSWRQWRRARFEAVAVEEKGWAGEPLARRC